MLQKASSSSWCSQWVPSFDRQVAYTYLVNDYWALELKPKYAFVNYADPSLDIQWENLEEAEVSEADKNHPLLKDVKPLKAEDL